MANVPLTPEEEAEARSLGLPEEQVELYLQSRKAGMSPEEIVAAVEAQEPKRLLGTDFPPDWLGTTQKTQVERELVGDVRERIGAERAPLTPEEEAEARTLGLPEEQVELYLQQRRAGLSPEQIAHEAELGRGASLGRSVTGGLKSGLGYSAAVMGHAAQPIAALAGVGPEWGQATEEVIAGLQPRPSEQPETLTQKVAAGFATLPGMLPVFYGIGRLTAGVLGAGTASLTGAALRGSIPRLLPQTILRAQQAQRAAQALALGQATATDVATFATADYLASLDPKEAARGALFGAGLGFISPFSRVVRVPLASAWGATLSAVGGGTVTDAVSQAVLLGTLTGLHAGQHKDFVDQWTNAFDGKRHMAEALADHITKAGTPVTYERIARAWAEGLQAPTSISLEELRTHPEFEGLEDKLLVFEQARIQRQLEWVARQHDLAMKTPAEWPGAFQAPDEMPKTVLGIAQGVQIGNAKGFYKDAAERFVKERKRLPNAEEETAMWKDALEQGQIRAKEFVREALSLEAEVNEGFVEGLKLREPTYRTLEETRPLTEPLVPGEVLPGYEAAPRVPPEVPFALGESFPGYWPEEGRLPGRPIGAPLAHGEQARVAPFDVAREISFWERRVAEEFLRAEQGETVSDVMLEITDLIDSRVYEPSFLDTLLGDAGDAPMTLTKAREVRDQLKAANAQFGPWFEAAAKAHTVPEQYAEAARSVKQAASPEEVARVQQRLRNFDPKMARVTEEVTRGIYANTQKYRAKSGWTKQDVAAVETTVDALEGARGKAPTERALRFLERTADQAKAAIMGGDLPERSRSPREVVIDHVNGIKHVGEIHGKNFTEDLKARAHTVFKEAFGDLGWRDRNRARRFLYLLIETGGDRAKLEPWYDKLSPKWQRYADDAHAFWDRAPESVRNFVREMRELDQRLGLTAQEGGVLGTLIDDHIPHLWRGTDKATRRMMRGNRDAFFTRYPFAKQRTFGSILEGLASGRVEPVTLDFAEVLGVEYRRIQQTLANRAFIAELRKVNVDGVPLLASRTQLRRGVMRGLYDKSILDQYAPIDSQSFKTIAFRGFKFETGPETLATEEALMAPAPIAWHINNINSLATGPTNVGERLAWRTSLHLKHFILSYSTFHFLALARSAGFGYQVFPWEFKAGLEKVQAENPALMFLVQNGLTLFGGQDIMHKIFRESELRSNIPGVREVFGAHRWFQSALWDKYFIGLKAQSAMRQFRLESEKEFRRSRREGREPDLVPVARRVAHGVNADFGGLNLEELGRSRRFQTALQIAFLAPDWTESNLRLMVGVAPWRSNRPLGMSLEIGAGRMSAEQATRMGYGGMQGPRAEGPSGRGWNRPMLDEMTSYGGFWLRTFILGELARNVASKAINGYWAWEYKDPEDAKHPFELRMGEDAQGRALYVNLYGHLLDPLKLLPIFSPERHAWKNKLSVVAKMALNQLYAEDWKGYPFATLDDIKQWKFEHSPYAERSEPLMPWAIPAVGWKEFSAKSDLPGRAYDIGTSILPIPLSSTGKALIGITKGEDKRIQSPLQALGSGLGLYVRTGEAPEWKFKRGRRRRRRRSR